MQSAAFPYKREFPVRSKHCSVLCLILPLALFFPNTALATAARSYFYVTQPGDTLGSILRSLNLRPMYGRSGSLNKLASCNRSRNSLNFIRVGDVLHLSFKLDSRLERFVQVSEQGELKIDRKWMKAQSQKGMFQRLAPDLYTTSSHASYDDLCRTPDPSLNPTPKHPQSETAAQRIEHSAIHHPKVTIQSSRQAVSDSRSKGGNADKPSARAVEPSVQVLQFVPNVESEDSWAPRSEVGASVMQLFERHDFRTVNGGYSLLLSSASLGFSGYWREDVARSWDVELSALHQRVRFVPPLGETISGDSVRTDFGVIGLGTVWGDLARASAGALRIGAGVKYGTTPITTHLGNSVVREHSPQVFRALGIIEHDMAVGSSQKRMRVRTRAETWYSPSSSQTGYKIMSGLGYGFGSRILRFMAPSFGVFGGFCYRFSKFDSSLGKHADTEITGDIGLMFSFMPPEQNL